MEEKKKIVDLNKSGLIPAIIQDFATNEVLMLAYMSSESLQKTMETKTTWFWSRSRQRLWNKGETSGNVQEVKEIRYDCDSDTLLIKVQQIGNACHTGKKSCFFSEIPLDVKKGGKEIGNLQFKRGMILPQDILDDLYSVIKERIKEKNEESYTYSLHKKGIGEILKKVGEESIEVLLASKNESRQRVIYEIADLLYHLLVLMVEEKIKLEDIYEELRSRRK